MGKKLELELDAFIICGLLSPGWFHIHCVQIHTHRRFPPPKIDIITQSIESPIQGKHENVERTIFEAESRYALPALAD